MIKYDSLFIQVFLIITNNGLRQKKLFKLIEFNISLVA